MVTIPTVAQLKASIISDLEAEMGVQISPFGKAFLTVLAGVQAAKLKLFYLYLGFVQRNTFPDLADSEFIGGTLERYGRVKLGRNPFSATAGQYSITVTGSIGATIPAQTIFKSDDSSNNPGYLFTVDNAFTFVGTSGTITIRSLTTGTIAGLLVTDTLTVTSPIALVDSGAVVSAITIDSQDAETLDIYRQRIIESFRLEPQGGAASDYRLWAADAQGVRQTYIYATTGATNEVDVYVEATDADSVPVDSGIPTVTILTAVEDVIEFDPDTTRPLNERGRRPVQVVVNVLPVAPDDIDIDIVGFTGTLAQQTIIEGAIESYVDLIRPFVAGADVLADSNDTISLNGLIYTIQDAAQGTNFTSISMTVNAVPQSIYQFLLGAIPKVNSITFS